MDNKKILKEGLTYDDVLVIPAYSEVCLDMLILQQIFQKILN